MSRKHAMLSASGSDRWLKCTPSASVEEAKPKHSYAEEGTFAHALAELLLKHKLGMVSDTYYTSEYNSLKGSMYYNITLENNVKVYVDYVLGSIDLANNRSSNTVYGIEQNLDFSKWVPDGFGTGDAIIISDGIMEVIDLKYGWSPVDVINNTQLRLYGLGALHTYGDQLDVHTIALSVIQPRVAGGRPKREVLSVDELMRWVEVEVVDKAQDAYEGLGEFNPGEHCKFCDIKSTCKERTEKNLELLGYNFKDPIELEEDEIQDVLDKALELRRWVSDVEAHAERLAVEKGQRFEGRKVVYSSNLRRYSDEDKVMRVLKGGGYDLDTLAPRKPLSIGRMEEALGVEVFANNLGHLTHRQQGRMMLVPDSDRRYEVFPDKI